MEKKKTSRVNYPSFDYTLYSNSDQMFRSTNVISSQLQLHTTIPIHRGAWTHKKYLNNIDLQSIDFEKANKHRKKSKVSPE